MAETSAPSRRHVCFLIGAIILLLTALAHGAAQLLGPSPTTSEEHATMLQLMQTVPLDIAGKRLTMYQITEGFSWFFTAALAFFGFLSISLWAKRRADRGLMHLVAVLNGLFFAGMTALSATHFPLPPTIFLGTAAVMFLIGAATA